MTIFAVMCAGLFPLIHMGRPWLAYWIMPYPNDRGSLWVNFRSPLVWDFFAISTYFLISLTFWYVGLVPDLATARDRAQHPLRKRIFTAMYSGNVYEQFVTMNRAMGPMYWAYWTMVSCNVLVPQLLWFKAVRSNLLVVFVLTIFVNIGMWFERFVIVVISLHRDFLPSSWADYTPTSIEVATLVGSFGLFFTCFLLFCRVLPMIAIGEIKGVLKEHH